MTSNIVEQRVDSMSRRDVEGSEASDEILMYPSLDIISTTDTSIVSQTMLVNTSLIVELYLRRI
jgi:hypothetical protein